MSKRVLLKWLRCSGEFRFRFKRGSFSFFHFSIAAWALAYDRRDGKALVGKTYACVEGTLFHPAQRECLSNEDVWKDGFCPLLTASADSEDDVEDNDDDAEDEDAAINEDEVMNGISEGQEPTEEMNEDIKFNSKAAADDFRTTPKTAEFEDPVRPIKRFVSNDSVRPKPVIFIWQTYREHSAL